MPWLIPGPKGTPRINRITYEICVLEALRERLRSKEVWVVGADRYRNPDEDLPADFADRRAPYYEALGLPLDADMFIAGLQVEMRAGLARLDAGLPRNLGSIRISGVSTQRRLEQWLQCCRWRGSGTIFRTMAGACRRACVSGSVGAGGRRAWSTASAGAWQSAC